MKTNYIIVILVLFLSSVFLIVKIKKLNNSIDLVVNEIKLGKTKSDIRNDLLKKKVLSSIKYSKKITFSSNSYFTDDNNKSYRLSEIVGTNRKLIYRFTEKNCGSCIETEFLKLKKYASVIGPKNIFLLVSYQQVNDLKILKNLFHIDFQIVNTPLENLDDNSIEQLNVPYLFLLDKFMNSEMVFIPDENFPDLTDSYYLNMHQYFK